MALERGGPAACATRHYMLAGRPVRMRVIGEALAEEMDRPFSHLRCDPTPYDALGLTIDLWDELATGVTCETIAERPNPPAGAAVSVSEDARFLIHTRAQTVSGFDRAARRIVGWVGDASRLTLYERGRPLHSHLLLWLRDRRVQPVHAGLVSRDGAGVLLGGAGGSGKSTVALTCLNAGFLYQADDYVGLEKLADGSLIGHSLYNSTHVDPGHLKRFPWLEPHARAGSLSVEDKSLALLSDVHPEGLSRTASVKALALPRVVASADTTVRPATRVEALLRLAPSSILQLPHAGIVPGALDRLSDLVESVPAFWLELGQDVSRIPVKVGEILETVAKG